MTDDDRLDAARRRHGRAHGPRRRAGPCAGDRRRAPGPGRGEEGRRDGRQRAGAARPRRGPHGRRARRRHRVGQVEPVQRDLPARLRRRRACAGRRPRRSRRACGATTAVRCSTGSASCRTAGSSARACSTARARRRCAAWCCSTCPTTTRSRRSTARSSTGCCRRPTCSPGWSTRRSTPTTPCTAATCAGWSGTRRRWSWCSTRSTPCRPTCDPTWWRTSRTSSSTTGSRASRSARRPPAPARASSRCASSWPRTSESRSLAARRASAELNDAAALLAAEVAAREPAPAALSVTDVVDRLAAAIGLPAVAAGVGAAVRTGSTSAPGFGAVQEDAVELARATWLEAVTAGLPRRWGKDVASRVASTTEMRLAVTDALTQLTLTARRSGLALGADGRRRAARRCGAARRVGRGRLAGRGGGAERVGSRGGGRAARRVRCVAFVGAGAARRSAGRRRTARVLQDGRSALENVARARLAVPTEAVLAEHRTVRELVAAARA